MSLLDRIIVLILTYNEEANIGRTLDGVAWAKRIVVVDSGSTDRTAEIVRAYPQAELVVRSFDTHEAQWNFGLAVCGNDSEWILALDADYRLDQACRDEIAVLTPDDDVVGYRARFRYCMMGRPLRGNLYPPVVALYRRSRAHYTQSGHTQRLVANGRIADLKSKIDHDDRKPLSRWLSAQQRYAELEADHLVSTPTSELRRVDRIRRMGWPAPFLVFFYTLIVKRCIFDGGRGWMYVLQRTAAEVMIALNVVDARLRLTESGTAQHATRSDQNVRSVRSKAG
jgi:glycosyltransferase involved in cell wall biosynthesis